MDRREIRQDSAVKYEVDKETDALVVAAEDAIHKAIAAAKA
jgi:hypothetical protein